MYVKQPSMRLKTVSQIFEGRGDSWSTPEALTEGENPDMDRWTKASYATRNIEKERRLATPTKGSKPKLTGSSRPKRTSGIGRNMQLYARLNKLSR